jgi:diguanylate cyclase (GGDEF)-like protein
MANPRPEADARPSVDAVSRVGTRSKLGSIALVGVLLSVSVFAVWSSQATAAAANRAIDASALSDSYSDAARLVAEEESLERKYRLEPGPEVRARYNQTAADFVAALGRVRQDGAADDRSFVRRVLSQHSGYLVAIDRMFSAVDRGDAALVLRIDAQDVDPPFDSMEAAVLAAADATHRESLDSLAALNRLESMTRALTPLVFLVGLILVGALVMVTRGHRRLLMVERAQAVHDSLHDSLTGLPNRTLLADRFAQALRADVRAGTCTGLLLLDLDRFKEINDTFGHHYGDGLLAQIGPRLKTRLRDVDTVARLGGDEFAVLLPDVHSVEEATGVARQLRACLNAPFSVLGVDLDVEASVGVVVSREHGFDATVLLQRADVAMYFAKAQSEGVSVYNADLDLNTPAKLALLGGLRRALENHELVLHFQPQLSISTGDVVGVEALIRWEHPERGLVLPDDFIPMAEHTGLIGALTREVLDVALAQVRSWGDGGRELAVSVNISARNLIDELLPETVAELLTTHGVAARLLKIEVTESALMSEPLRAKAVLERLSALGVQISIDDFGAGYTSLGQLKALPVSELKIDKSFVITMMDETVNDLIVHSVIDLGHNLGLSIVAEGIESEQILTVLRTYGCDVGQGYHLGMPLPISALEVWLADRPASVSLAIPTRSLS